MVLKKVCKIIFKKVLNKKQKAQMIFYEIMMLSLSNRLNYGKVVYYLLHLILAFNYLLHPLFKLS